MQQFGKYEVVDQLGRGGMGVVLKARDPILDRFVAIKILKQAIADDADLLKRFEREAKSAAGLSHANLVQVYDYGEEQGQPYFVMEFVAGESLSARMRREGKMTSAQASDIILQTAKGLSAAHEQGIIHRDIKPANIMLSPKGEVKVADFGIAHLNEQTENLTATGQVLGTPGYMPPDVCTGEPLDGRADIYSLGVVFFEMLAGAKPYQATTIQGWIYHAVNTQIPDVRNFNNQVDQATLHILNRMMAKKKEDRYPNCEALIADLQSAHAGTIAGVSGVTVPIEPAPLPFTVPNAQQEQATETSIRLNAPLPPPIPQMEAPQRADQHIQEQAQVISPPVQPPSPPKPRSKAPWLIAALALIVLLMILAGAAYFLASRFLAKTSPNIAYFNATANTLERGQESTLSWSTSGADQVELTPLGLVEAEGMRRISPQDTTTYTLTAINEQGADTAKITLVVQTGDLNATTGQGVAVSEPNNVEDPITPADNPTAQGSGAQQRNVQNDQNAIPGHQARDPQSSNDTAKREESRSGNDQTSEDRNTGNPGFTLEARRTLTSETTPPVSPEPPPERTKTKRYTNEPNIAFIADGDLAITAPFLNRLRDDIEQDGFSTTEVLYDEETNGRIPAVPVTDTFYHDGVDVLGMVTVNITDQYQSQGLDRSTIYTATIRMSLYALHNRSVAMRTFTTEIRYSSLKASNEAEKAAAKAASAIYRAFK